MGLETGPEDSRGGCGDDVLRQETNNLTEKSDPRQTLLLEICMCEGHWWRAICMHNV